MAMLRWLRRFVAAPAVIGSLLSVPAGASDVGTWMESTPPLRQFPGLYLDESQGTLLVFAGNDAASARAEVWQREVDGTWSMLQAAGSPPSGGCESFMDPLRHRVVVVGGGTDVWFLDLATSIWTHATAAGFPTSIFYGPSITYDPTHDRLLMFGGQGCCSNPTFYSDVWELRLGEALNWTLLSHGPLPGRSGASLIVDAPSRALIVHGGYGGFMGGDSFGDTWTMNLDDLSWHEVHYVNSGPPLYGSLKFILKDTRRGRFLVLGESSHWALSIGNLGRWEDLAPTGQGPASAFEAWAQHAVYDSTNDRVISGTWTLDLSPDPHWTRVEPIVIPKPDAGNRLVYDEANDRALLWTGRIGGFSEIWELSLSTLKWSQIVAIPAGPRIEPIPPRLIFDPPANRLITFHKQQIWELSLSSTPPSWVQMEVEGPIPPPWVQQSILYDPFGRRMIAFGGSYTDSANYGATNDVWALSLGTTPRWTHLAPQGPLPPPRDVPNLVYDSARRRMITYGSYESHDTWALSLEGLQWEMISSTGPEWEHSSAIYDAAGDRLVIFGGSVIVGTYQFTNDVYALPLGAPGIWTRLEPSGPSPDPRASSAMIYDSIRDRMITFGGASGGADTRVLDWGRLSSTGIPARSSPATGLGLEESYPHPGSGGVSLLIRISSTEIATLEVFDVSGRLVERHELLDGPGSQALRLESSRSWPPGIYWARLAQGRNFRTLKLVRLP